MRRASFIVYLVVVLAVLSACVEERIIVVTPTPVATPTSVPTPTTTPAPIVTATSRYPRLDGLSVAELKEFVFLQFGEIVGSLAKVDYFYNTDQRRALVNMGNVTGHCFVAEEAIKTLIVTDVYETTWPDVHEKVESFCLYLDAASDAMAFGETAKYQENVASAITVLMSAQSLVPR